MMVYVCHYWMYELRTCFINKKSLDGIEFTTNRSEENYFLIFILYLFGTFCFDLQTRYAVFLFYILGLRTGESQLFFVC